MTRDKGTRIVLSVTGSDSGGGTGIQADLKTFAAHGVYGTSAITSVTAQNTVAIVASEVLPDQLVARQMDAVLEDMDIHAAKTGMLGNASIVSTVAERLAEHGIEKTVVDPVMVAKSGARLLERDAVDSIRTELIPRAYLVTPNLTEAETLVGFACEDESSTRAAARRIVEMGAKAAVIKGAPGKGEESVDLLYTGRSFRELRAPRLGTGHARGAGAVFSAAIAARLALGDELELAVSGAKEFVTMALSHALDVGGGPGPVDPFAGAL